MLNDEVGTARPDHSLESRTRDRLLRVVSEDGPLTASALAERLDLTDTAIRRHLENLLTDGLIEPHDAGATSRGRGRPARAWVVSASGHQALASDYDHLAGQALRFLADTAGQGAVAAFAERRVAELEQRCAAKLADAGPDPAARVDVLIDALSAQGFAASARSVGPAATTAFTGIQVCQGHCPVGHVAAEFPQLCDAETEAFSRMLGVHVQRLATLAHGDHVCTTFVPTPSAATARGSSTCEPGPVTTEPSPHAPARPTSGSTRRGSTAPGHHPTPTQERSAR